MPVNRRNILSNRLQLLMKWVVSYLIVHSTTQAAV